MHADAAKRGRRSAQEISPQWVDLEGGDAVLCADDGEQVVAEGVGHVLAPVGVRALARHVALHSEALQAASRSLAYLRINFTCSHNPDFLIIALALPHRQAFNLTAASSFEGQISKSNF